MKKRRDLKQQLELARKFEQGSLSREEFAKMHGVCMNTVDLWRRRLKTAECDTMDAEFTELTVMETSNEQRHTLVELELPGVKLRIYGPRS
ncbi:MAG: hypothetical protein KC800_17165 [Candidatus Eremiobacteraeota bacterium]|nr:hypothetical protein [Candidatus Eremiobacteraeota bacterium]